MDRQTKAKIDSLLRELRSWDPSEPPPKTLSDVASQFQLDPMIVKRVAQSEGWTLNGDVPYAVDPLADTQPIPAPKKK